MRVQILSKVQHGFLGGALAGWISAGAIAHTQPELFCKTLRKISPVAERSMCGSREPREFASYIQANNPPSKDSLSLTGIYGLFTGAPIGSVLGGIGGLMAGLLSRRKQKEKPYSSISPSTAQSPLLPVNSRIKEFVSTTYGNPGESPILDVNEIKIDSFVNADDAAQRIREGLDGFKIDLVRRLQVNLDRHLQSMREESGILPEGKNISTSVVRQNMSY